MTITPLSNKQLDYPLRNRLVNPFSSTVSSEASLSKSTSQCHYTCRFNDSKIDNTNTLSSSSSCNTISNQMSLGKLASAVRSVTTAEVKRVLLVTFIMSLICASEASTVSTGVIGCGENPVTAFVNLLNYYSGSTRYTPASAVLLAKAQDFTLYKMLEKQYIAWKSCEEKKEIGYF